MKITRSSIEGCHSIVKNKDRFDVYTHSTPA